jgi:hypothetical protein
MQITFPSRLWAPNGLYRTPPEDPLPQFKDEGEEEEWLRARRQRLEEEAQREVEFNLWHTAWNAARETTADGQAQRARDAEHERRRSEVGVGCCGAWGCGCECEGSSCKLQH